MAEDPPYQQYAPYPVKQEKLVMGVHEFCMYSHENEPVKQEVMHVKKEKERVSQVVLWSATSKRHQKYNSLSAMSNVQIPEFYISMDMSWASYSKKSKQAIKVEPMPKAMTDALWYWLGNASCEFPTLIFLKNEKNPLIFF